MSTPTEPGRGFLPLPRDLIFSKPNLLNNDERMAFLYLCQEAAWCDHTRKIQNAIELERRGAVIVSRRYMADKVCMPPSTLGRFLERLEAEGEISLSRTSRGTTVVTILAYDDLFCNGSARINPDQAEDVACGDADMEAIPMRCDAPGRPVDTVQSKRDLAHRGSTQRNSYTPNRIQKDPPDLSPAKPASEPSDDSSIEVKPELLHAEQGAPVELVQTAMADQAGPQQLAGQAKQVSQASAKPRKAATRKACPVSSDDVVLEAVDAWNDMANANDMNPAPEMTHSRKAMIRARVREAGGIDGWRAVIATLPTSWLAKSGRTWLEDILTESMFRKLRDGFYHREFKQPCKLDYLLEKWERRGDASWMADADPSSWLDGRPEDNGFAGKTIDVDGNPSEAPIRFDGMGDSRDPIIDPHAEMQRHEDRWRLAALEQAHRNAENENYVSATYGSPDEKAAAAAGPA